MLEVVVCRCGEDLAWTRNLPRGVRLTVYDKTPSPGIPWPGSLPLPNVGREAHAWLHHLVQRYDSLSAWTLFAQGRPFDHAPDLHTRIRRMAAGDLPGEDFVWLGFLWETDDVRGRPNFVNWTKNPERRELDLSGFFSQLWNQAPPPLVRFVVGGQFVLSRQRAHQRPFLFYKQALALAATYPDAAHVLERTWDRVFLAPPLDPKAFGHSGMRIWKPVRKLKAAPAEPSGQPSSFPSIANRIVAGGDFGAK